MNVCKVRHHTELDVNVEVVFNNKTDHVRVGLRAPGFVKSFILYDVTKKFLPFAIFPLSVL